MLISCITGNRRAGLFRGRRYYALVVLTCLFLAFVAAPAFAAHYVPYAWTEADLALLYPAGWADPVPASAADFLTLTLSGGDTTITLVVLPVASDDAALRAALDARIAAAGLLPLRYSLAPLYGRGGLRAEAVSADRQRVGEARAGRLPDDRALIVVGRAPQTSVVALESDFAVILNSLVFSAGAPPIAPSYSPLWSTAPNGRAAVGLALSGDRLYSVSAEDGVEVYDAATGTLVAAYSFERPAQPTGLAVAADGAVYVGDSVCRCVRVLDAAGRWGDMLGSFGGGAPFSLSLAPDGTLYAVDKTDEGYLLRMIDASVSRRVPLNFNAGAPPLVTIDSAGQVWVIEWLASLIDGAVSGAVSRIGGAKPAAELQFWLEGLTPDAVTAITTDPKGELVVATSDRGIFVVDSSGQAQDQIAQNARALAFGADGTLYLAGADGALMALSTRGTPDRFGGSALALGAAAGGNLSESAPQQDWTYSGAAGEIVTISAVDQTRTDTFAVGLDTALRLIAPDGSEVAYNDDQQGADLFGVYDAQLARVTLPQAGTYTVRVEWRQGQGIYTLGISEDRPVEVGSDGVMRIEGRLQDVFPVQRWTFAGHEGDVLTITMSAEDGTLDPALALYKPDGSLLAFNDDALDVQLQNDAQLSQVRLPVNGTYTVAASRYEGAGRYSIVVVNTG